MGLDIADMGIDRTIGVGTGEEVERVTANPGRFEKALPGREERSTEPYRSEIHPFPIGNCSESL